MMRRQSASGNVVMRCDAAMPAALTRTSSCAELVDGGGHGAPARAGIGDVAFDRDRTLQRCCGLVGLVVSEIETGDGCAFAREAVRDGASDSCAGARHEGDLGGESFHRVDGTRR